MSESCEIFQASLSALIDGELEGPEQLPTIDHLLECASCRLFYRRARSLGDLMVSAESQRADPAPEEVWKKIVKQSGVRGHKNAWEVRRFSRWAVQIAAVLVLAVGLWWIKPESVSNIPAPVVSEDEVDVILEEDRDSMTEERFVELATEILRADRTYHRKMYEVMSVVTAMTEKPEGSSDGADFAASEGSFDESRETRRISLGEDRGEEDFAWDGDRL